MRPDGSGTSLASLPRRFESRCINTCNNHRIGIRLVIFHDQGSCMISCFLINCDRFTWYFPASMQLRTVFFPLWTVLRCDRVCALRGGNTCARFLVIGTLQLWYLVMCNSFPRKIQRFGHLWPVIIRMCPSVVRTSVRKRFFSVRYRVFTCT